MKKIMKETIRIVLALIFVFSTFGIITTFANQSDFSITNIVVKEISDKTIVNKANLSSEKIDNDIIFSSVGDYIKYNITIKNNTEETKIIKSISDDNSSPYLEYTYDDLKDVKVESNEEKTFELQIKYIQKTNNQIISDDDFNLTLTYDKYIENTNNNTTDNNTNNNSTDNNTNNNTQNNSTDNSTNTDNTSTSVINVSNKIVNNPKTYDNILIYIVLGVISLGGLILTTKSKITKKLMIVGLFLMSLIPFGINADSDKYIVSYSPNIIRNSSSKLISGIDFNLAISKLSSGNDNLDKAYRFERNILVNNNYSDGENGYLYENTDITSIKRATLEQYKEIKDTLTDKNIVSTDDSVVPTYAWFDNGIIYYYSHTETIYMNEIASSMFYNMVNLTSDIDLSTIDTSRTIDMGNMFRNDYHITSLDLTTFDTSNVIDVRDMFNNCSISNINLSTWDTSKVIYFQGMLNGYLGETIDLSNFDTRSAEYLNHMFANNYYLKSINLTNFNTSNTVSMAAMFMNCSNLTSINISSFNTKKVTDMSNMFRGCSELTSLDLSNFDTRNLTIMYDMFSLMDNLTSLNITSFNTSKAVDMHGLFAANGLATIDLSSFDTKNVEDMSYMFSDMPNLIELDLSYFNTKKVTNTRSMFDNSPLLTTIYASEYFTTTSITDSTDMFLDAVSIDGGNGTLYDSRYIDKEYAHFDGGISNPGYFHQTGTYRVMFDSKGGSSVDTKIINRGSQIGTLETPTKDGFTFVGWYLDDTKIENDYVPTANITLVARYQTNGGFDANIYATWIWDGTLQNILDSEAHMDESINVLNALGVKEVYLSILPEDLESNSLYFEKLNDDGIKIYVLYGDPVFVEESHYSDVVDYDMEKVAEYNANHEGSSHIEGIHYDVEYHGYKYDGVNTCPDGNTEDALTCSARQKYVNFVKRGYAKSRELGLKTQYDVTVYGTNYSFYYNENHEVVNLLDEIIDYCDDLIVMSYGNSPKNTIPSYLFKGTYTYNGATNYIDKNYYEKMHERNKNIYVGQEVEVFKNTAKELEDYPELGPIYLPEYEGENGTNYIYTYDFVMGVFNDLEDTFRDNGIDDIRITVHDFSQLRELYESR